MTEDLTVNEQDREIIVQITADGVSAYVSNNSVRPTEVTQLISDVHHAFEELRKPSNFAAVAVEVKNPAVSIKKSITSDNIICLQCGKGFKSLKRHIKTHHDMTPEQYREHWDLPRDYPMVAANYAEARSNLAKQMGLGRKPKSQETVE
jgi:predicted transcriptional regulator